jgi:hypothetical protein
MTRILWGAALAWMLAVPVHAQPAATRAGGNVCLTTWQIDRTTTPDTHTILFHMHGGKIWKNTLRNDCIGLKEYGFAYEPTAGTQICGNLQTIRIPQTGSVCLLGAFESYKPPKKAHEQ